MFDKQVILPRKPFVTAYEGEDDTVVKPEPTVVKPEPKSGNEPKTFTQEQLDKIVQERLAREKETQKELVNKLSDLEQGKSLSDEERAKLQKRIEELKNEFMSVEEKANKDVKQWEEKYKKDVTDFQTKAQSWQENYFSYRMERELMDAALANDARVPQQLVRLLKSDTKIKEVIDDKGNVIPNQYEVKVSITQLKEDGTPFTVELSPAQALAKLREMPEQWGNQFNAKSVDGTGAKHDIMTKPNANYDGLVVGKDFETYKKSRESAKGKAALGLDKETFKR